MGIRRSPSPERSRSPSPESPKSDRSRSRSRSRSAASNASNRSRSRSASSNRSSARSARSTSKTPSQRSSRSGGSRSGSGSRSRSRSRSGSAGSNARSKSRSRSRSASGSVQSNRSNRSVQSGKSASKSPSQRSRSRSKSSEPEDDKGADAADLFGDADDISSDEDRAKETAASTTSRTRRSDDDDVEDDVERRDPPPTEADERSGDEDAREKRDEEKEGEELDVVPETRIDVKIPKISCDLGKEIHFVKLPNFLSVETRPFDPETYEDEIDEEETLDEEGRARLKLKVENTMRWREEINKNGDFIKQSNARLVRWSDGSLSLHLGAEIFDVYKQPLQGDHNHLFIRQGTGLQGQAVFRTKLSFRPHSTESFTHRKMTLSLADRSQKTSGIKILSQVGIDPDQDRKTLLKKEEEKLRQTFRQSKPRKRGDGGRLHVGAAYREEDGSEDEGAISLNAIKNKYKSGAAGAGAQSKAGGIYSSDEEGSDFEARRSRKLDKPRALKDSESSEESD